MAFYIQISKGKKLALWGALAFMGQYVAPLREHNRRNLTTKYRGLNYAPMQL